MQSYYQYQQPYEQYFSQGIKQSKFQHRERNETPSQGTKQSKFQHRERNETPSQGTKQSKFQHRERNETPSQASSSASITRQCDIIDERANVISSEELTSTLDKVFKDIEKLPNQKQQIANLKDIITVLIQVRQPILESVVQHKFFTLLQIPLNQILRQWNQTLSLDEDDSIIFRNLIKLLRKLFRNIEEIQLYPSWFTDASLLDTIAVCLTNLSKSNKYFHKNNRFTAKIFIYLFDIYDEYQDLLNTETNTNQEILAPLRDPVIQCLTSNLYLDSFDNLQKGASLRSKQEKFFLSRCPKFLTSYNGSRLEEIMNNLLSTMLPKYTKILDKVISSVHQWKHPMIRAVNHLLQIINHGSINPNIISTHLSIIDHVLNIINVPTFYNKLEKKLSNPETNLINTAINLLVNYIGEPTVLAHIKQKKVTSSFLRFKSAAYEPLVDNIYTLLGYTTSEDDIKSMQNPGILLSTVTKGLKTEMDGQSFNEDRVVQLIETLKGLVQHDQLKGEILKQNILSFLLQCMNRLAPSALTSLLETFWSLSFSSDLATALRGNPELLQKIQAISKDSKDEALKKAADGLVWKLVQEPAFLEKAAKAAAAAEDETPVTKVIIGEDGKEKVITTTKKVGAGVQAERTFEYDIMISYCHADKDLIIKIHKFLVNEGFKVWIDLDNMFGPAMNAMAEAVENSEFVLLSMSDSYKQSTYCQAEAEYAFGCKRRLVPLIVRPGYRADGWLGFMIGARIYIDFGSFDFDTACEKLITEIARQRKRPLPPKPEKTQKPAKAAVAATTAVTPAEHTELFSQKLPGQYTKRDAKSEFNSKSIEYWIESDVLDFLYNHQLNELMPLCEKMNGPALIQLNRMCQTRHDRTYMILNEQLKEMYKIILPIGTYTRFLSIMEKLIKPSPQPILPPPSQNTLPPPPQYTLPPQPVQRMLPPPPQYTLPPQPVRRMLPPPPQYTLPPQPVQQMLPPPPIQLQQPTIQGSNLPYDIIVTSDMPVSQILKMVERTGARWRMKNYA